MWNCGRKNPVCVWFDKNSLMYFCLFEAISKLVYYSLKHKHLFKCIRKCAPSKKWRINYPNSKYDEECTVKHFAVQKNSITDNSLQYWAHQSVETEKNFFDVRCYIDVVFFSLACIVYYFPFIQYATCNRTTLNFIWFC